MNRKKTYRWIALALLVVSLVQVAVSFGTKAPGNTMVTAIRVESALKVRLDILDRFAQRALEQDPSEWLEVGRLPQDMVIYRYCNDTLQSWVNRFSTSNDQLSSGVMLQSLVSPRSGFRSPLSEIGEELTFCNVGPKWYLAKVLPKDDVKLIVGLEVMNTMDDRSFRGINPKLRVPDNCSVSTLSSSGGSEVAIDGHPLFKILNDSLSPTSPASMPFLWLALTFFLSAAMLFLFSNPTIKNLAIEVAVVMTVLLGFYFGGAVVSTHAGLFSPMLYADGKLFYSIGGLLLLSLMIVMPIWSSFAARRALHAFWWKRTGRWMHGLFLLLLAAGVVVFSFVAIKSITLNSNITLEIYKIKELSWMSALVYLMLILLLSCVPMLLQMLQPITSSLFGFHQDSMSIGNRIGFSLLVAAYLVAVTANLGFRKEQASLEVWANRLAVSRDITLEMQLRSVENKMASDPMIATFSVLQNAASTIRNRIADAYLPRIAQEYELTVQVGNIDVSLLEGGEYLSPDSRFLFAEESGGIARYSALFSYVVRGYGVTNVLVTVEQKGDWRYRGYASILGESQPGQVLIPSSYAYARYQGRDLAAFRGNFAYPVKMDDKLADAAYVKKVPHLKRGGSIHFIYVVAENESVIVSRSIINATYYAISGIFIGLLVFLALTLTSSLRHRRKSEGETYFKARLSLVIMISLSLALVSIAAVSVYFVWIRNEQNRRTLMTEKINSIAASISARIRGARTTEDLRVGDVLGVIEVVGNNTNSDITLYDAKGMAIMSTAPAVFDRALMYSRIDGEAFRNIIMLTSRYYIQTERVGKNRFYSMYAPLVGEEGDIIAIICSPYTDDTYEFETNAVNHFIMVISVFIFLLLCASFMTRRVLDRMFKPLLQIGRKMEDANLDSLEFIRYDKQDEITSLVNAYNRMVADLSESSRQLAEAERDKAWSGMARQVAHEIKNPLTPMKLQIQRLVRLKAKGDPSWQDKFDEVSRMLLDHIDILTDTANEFSTFAKLYTEEPTEINLDRTLQEEIAMFSGREDVQFEYFGLGDAVVMGPKPQLTRVFVNLINNAVQALETESGGKVRVSLRNSVKDGYYDIVFEDNGPGVSPENECKLFTPNFTTKTAGSGLGLAISRSILQKCEATISYSKSFALGGACFTILYPKTK